jgi:hypothetical protein
MSLLRAWLDVPFDDKDAAKRAGARWDPQARRWYATRPGVPGLARWAARPDLPVLLPGEDRSFGGGALLVDPVPESCWFKNARSSISQRDWERVRRMVTERAGLRCEVCGRPPDRDAGRFLECHERWAYDAATRRQTLRRLICLDSDCHTVTHFGLAQIRGVDAEAFAHLCDVTGMSDAEARRHLESAFALWAQRSQVAWDLDLSILITAGVAIARPGGSDAARSGTAGRALIREAPPPPPTKAPLPLNPRAPAAKPESRWERWLRTGER